MGCYSSKLCSTDIIDVDDGDNKKKMVAEYAAEACSLILELRPSTSNVPKLKKLLLNSQDLLFLSKGYLSDVVATKKLLASLKLHLSEARDMQAIILQALKCHRSEGRKYPLTLQMLREFNEGGDPFAGSFTDEFSLLCEHLVKPTSMFLGDANPALPSVSLQSGKHVKIHEKTKALISIEKITKALIPIESRKNNPLISN